MPRLYVLSGDDLGRTYDFEGTAVLGRSTDAEVSLRSTAVSRRHAQLEPDGDRWFVEDLGSRNGVRVEGEKVERAEIRDGDVFSLGSLELRFRIAVAEGVGASPEVALPPDPTPTEPVFEVKEPSAPPALESHGLAAGDDEISLEGDWTDEPPPPVAPLRRSAPVSSPAPAQPEVPRGAQRTAQQQAKARAAALGGAALGEQKTSSGGRILQYSRHEDRHGFLNADLGQQSLLVRWSTYLFVAAVFLALGYGVFKLTSSLREKSHERNVVEQTE